MEVANSVVWMFWCTEREKKAMGDPAGLLRYSLQYAVAS
jgi:hypothetical protein